MKCSQHTWALPSAPGLTHPDSSGGAQACAQRRRGLLESGPWLSQPSSEGPGRGSGTLSFLDGETKVQRSHAGTRSRTW